MNILIVEDCKDSAVKLCRILSRGIPGVECRIAHTLSEGLELAAVFEASITILDLELPGSTRHQVLESIRRFRRPVFIVTGVVDEDNGIQIECYAHGAEGFFSKPALGTLISEITSAYMRDAFAPPVRSDVHP